MRPLLSIAIPTFNRSQYAIKCLISLLSIKGELEIVVSDSSSDRKLKNLLNNEYSYLLEDSRLNYRFTTEKLDMTTNLNKALESCSGFYITFIGDDDTLVPEVLLYLRMFKDKGIDAIAPDVVTNYAWPDFTTKFFKSGHKSNLYFDFNLPFIKKINTATAFNEAKKNCYQGTNGLPKLYHGFVRRELLVRIKKITGKYLHGSTPDISGAVGLCFVTDYFVRCNFPLTIPGASGQSNTGRAANNKHVGNLETENQTSDIPIDAWGKFIPRYFSVETVWAQSGIETALRFGEPNPNNFPYGKLIGICIINHPKLLLFNLRSAILLLRSKFGLFSYLIPWHAFIFLLEKILKIVKRLSNPTATNNRHHVKNISDIYEAQLEYKSNKIKYQNFDVNNNLKLIKIFKN
jgi:glycosyltransferase involved in cell wall biosynthesis